MDLVRLVYASQPFGFDDAILSGILHDARSRNLRDGITGALICRADLYLQLLEGPAAAVEATYRRILCDDRHLDVRLLARSESPERLFGRWAMRDDPAQSWMWTPAQVAGGAVDRASPGEAIGLFAQLSAQVNA